MIVEVHKLKKVKEKILKKRPCTSSDPGFALPIAIVAKCEEIKKLAQKKIIWRQLLAKEKLQEIFFVWRRNRHLRLQVIASCRLMVINVYLNCQSTPQLSTTQIDRYSLFPP